MSGLPPSNSFNIGTTEEGRNTIINIAVALTTRVNSATVALVGNGAKGG